MSYALLRRGETRSVRTLHVATGESSAAEERLEWSGVTGVFVNVSGLLLLARGKDNRGTVCYWR